jgi:ATP-dependent Clp protease protease subunit
MSRPPDEWLQDRLLDRRLVFLRGELDDELAGRIAVELMTLDATGDDPINLYVDSPGGTFEAAFTVIDTIDLVGIDVVTTAMGRVEGPAVGVVAVGHHRRATPNARFRLSQPNHTMTGRATELETWARHRTEQLANFVRRLAQATGQPPEHLEVALETGTYLNADEALHYRLIDEICARS